MGKGSTLSSSYCQFMIQILQEKNILIYRVINMENIEGMTLIFIINYEETSIKGNSSIKNINAWQLQFWFLIIKCYLLPVLHPLHSYLHHNHMQIFYIQAVLFIIVICTMLFFQFIKTSVRIKCRAMAYDLCYKALWRPIHKSI